ncbi:HNH endonuclease family protein [Marinitenerispora sediminis]|uniref:HNH endonuclease n=1 Tax=Marinitenerispora sediminis TaxID=1931232 RepID=A0A368T053_9ACTN|nr:HNH endonuclease family protein [Marinitenerispora sediminis]RCV48298.1 HNH endonuclease [Marinitenerispora sediminis]RCV49469.1 HNH endonuclease [Marinitenerispora sediminis]RCV52232.1 HNH endonuclease [Marinitenerispora sediminis]
MPRSSRPAARQSDRGRLAGVFASVVAVIALAALISALTGRDFFAGLRELTGDGPQAGGTAAPSQAPAPPADVREAREVLAGIEVAEPRPRGDYERDEFGSGWVDTDGNGCPTRHDVLARDLDDAVVESDCRVVAGVLDDPYTGERIEFSSDDPQAVQIDHVVPLSLAWRMGADEWDRDRRVEFANDFGNLLAADGPANGEKSDSGPAEWQPYAGYRCSYALSYIDVTHRYGLPLAAEDRDALAGMLDTCA